MELSREKIEIARARSRMTIEQLAKAYGVSRARMNVILNQREVTALCAGRLSDVLGVDIADIIED